MQDRDIQREIEKMQQLAQKQEDENNYIYLNARGAGALAVIMGVCLAIMATVFMLGALSGCALPDDDGESLPPPRPSKPCNDTCEPEDSDCKPCNEGALTDGSGGSHVGAGGAGGTATDCEDECDGPGASEEACELCYSKGS